jgi:haloalkane dehalogenase
MKDIAFREKELRRWTRALSNCQLHTFDDAGHYPHEEKHEEVLRLLTTFLDKNV